MIELVDQQRAPRHQEKCMVNIANPFIACTQAPGETGPTVFFVKVLTSDFLRNHASDRNSEGTLSSSTFDFVYWGTFSTPNSNVFVQENFFLILKR